MSITQSLARSRSRKGAFAGDRRRCESRPCTDDVWPTASPEITGTSVSSASVAFLHLPHEFVLSHYRTVSPWPPIARLTEPPHTRHHLSLQGPSRCSCPLCRPLGQRHESSDITIACVASHQRCQREAASSWDPPRFSAYLPVLTTPENLSSWSEQLISIGLLRTRPHFRLARCHARSLQPESPLNQKQTVTGPELQPASRVACLLHVASRQRLAIGPTTTNKAASPRTETSWTKSYEREEASSLLSALTDTRGIFVTGQNRQAIDANNPPGRHGVRPADGEGNTAGGIDDRMPSAE